MGVLELPVDNREDVQHRGKKWPKDPRIAFELPRLPRTAVTNQARHQQNKRRRVITRRLAYWPESWGFKVVI
jgi:hypothetical protein